MNGIVWLASYPKSGNTWLRALLTNALQSGEKPADINALLGRPAAPSRKLFDDWSGLKSSDLRWDEIERTRPRVYEALARSTPKHLFSKAHDACTNTSAGEPLFPLSATKAVIYIVRHPADVAVSYAHHRGCSVDEAIQLMANNNHTMAAGSVGVEGQLPQRLLSWSEHVASWLDSPHRVCCVKYEDLHRDTAQTLKSVLSFLGEDIPENRIARAVEYASFSQMRKQEAAGGFFESPSSKRTFFRSGKISGKAPLNGKQRGVISINHGVAMRRLGYGV